MNRTTQHLPLLAPPRAFSPVAKSSNLLEFFLILHFFTGLGPALPLAGSPESLAWLTFFDYVPAQISYHGHVVSAERLCEMNKAPTRGVNGSKADNAFQRN